MLIAFPEIGFLHECNLRYVKRSFVIAFVELHDKLIVNRSQEGTSFVGQGQLYITVTGSHIANTADLVTSLP